MMASDEPIIVDVTLSTEPPPFTNESYLWQLNDQRVYELLPVMIYLGIMSVIGTTGNIMVVYLFCTKFKQAPSTRFIIWLAVLDLIACVIGIPFELFDIRFSYTFDNTYACKAMRFVIYFTVMSSALTLIIMAIDRYYKICKPLQRYSVRFKKALIATLFLSILTASPAFLIFGIRPSEFHSAHIIGGFECSKDPSVQGTIFPLLYFGLLATIFLVSIVSLFFFYGRIVNTLCKRNKRLRSTSLSSSRLSMNMVGVHTTEVAGLTHTQHDTNSMDHHQSRTSIPSRGSIGASIPLNTQMSVSGANTLSNERTTVIFLSISIAFVLSFMPCLMIMTMRQLDETLKSPSSLAADITMNVFVRSYYINNVINPFIYGFLNPRFRRECFKSFTRCCTKEEEQHNSSGYYADARI